jgi:hypothetical protein
MQCLSTTDIGPAVIAFSDGWYAGVGSSSKASLRIVVGTNNLGSGVTQEHGQAWAAMIVQIAQTISSRPYAAIVNAVGGMDIEMLYGPPSAVMAWANGYGSNAYADYGDAEGCPQSCDGGWSSKLVVTLGGSTFLPEIYSSGGGNATEWAGLSKYYQTNYGIPLNIQAPLSEWTACLQRESTKNNCIAHGRIDNTPEIAWIQMVGSLAKVKSMTAKTLSPSSNIEHRVPL